VREERLVQREQHEERDRHAELDLAAWRECFPPGEDAAAHASIIARAPADR
jgi:hypothetical protein